MYASLIKNDGTFGGGQAVDGFGRIENSGLLWSALFVFAGYMKNAIAESSLRNSASAPEMWYCTVLGLMLSASAISL